MYTFNLIMVLFKYAACPMLFFLFFAIIHVMFPTVLLFILVLETTLKKDNYMYILEFLLIYFERDRDNTSRGGAERGRERILSRLRTVSTEPDEGLKPTNCEIMT